LHPGTSIKDSVFSNNISRGNTGDGLFFCANVRHIVVSNSVFAGNRGSGIGGLGNSEDKCNVISGNTCVRNGLYGILAIDGSDNVITGNVCVNNGQSRPGVYAGIGLVRTTDTLVTGNRCTDDQDAPTQKAGIEEGEGSDRNLIADNLCRGNAEHGIVAVGPQTAKHGNVE
jgi:parallel beta-helix repeat protein